MTSNLQKQTDIQITIRPGKEEDCPTIMSLIKDLAIYEGMPDQVKIRCEDLQRDAFHTNPPLLYTVVAELTSSDPAGAPTSENKNIVAYAIYYKTYSTWNGKAIHLEDLYVRPEYRFKKIGERILKYLSQVAEEENYARISFECIDWNESAMKFYKKHGAEDVTIKDHWHSYRFGKEALNNMVHN